jgi:hypothetical protein
MGNFSARKWKEKNPIQMTAIVIPSPIISKKRSSSRSPIQMRAMLKAGTKLESGIGSGKERKAADKTIASPQMR